LGYDTINDITACPGTDTCNLGIASSTGIAEELERVLKLEFQYKENREITIKISGCMNACGQHNMSAIGFRGCQCWKISSPSTSSTLGWWEFRNGSGRFQIK
jgi:sulfite reductase (ferredoxin)